jgi:hypothetical protein
MVIALDLYVIDMLDNATANIHLSRLAPARGGTARQYQQDTRQSEGQELFNIQHRLIPPYCFDDPA